MVWVCLQQLFLPGTYISSWVVVHMEVLAELRLLLYKFCRLHWLLVEYTTLYKHKWCSYDRHLSLSVPVEAIIQRAGKKFQHNLTLLDLFARVSCLYRRLLPCFTLTLKHNINMRILARVLILENVSYSDGFCSTTGRWYTYTDSFMRWYEWPERAPAYTLGTPCLHYPMASPQSNSHIPYRKSYDHTALALIPLHFLSTLCSSYVNPTR